jgi:hypothetical protein
MNVILRVRNLGVTYKLWGGYTGWGQPNEWRHKEDVPYNCWTRPRSALRVSSKAIPQHIFLCQDFSGVPGLGGRILSRPWKYFWDCVCLQLCMLSLQDSPLPSQRWGFIAGASWRPLTYGSQHICQGTVTPYNHRVHASLKPGIGSWPAYVDVKDISMDKSQRSPMDFYFHKLWHWLILWFSSEILHFWKTMRQSYLPFGLVQLWNDTEVNTGLSPWSSQFKLPSWS